jgi:hypothetical protein
VPIGWIILVIGITAGVLFGRWGLLVPGLAELAWWVGGDVSGAWENHSGNGDNLGAVGFRAAVVGGLIGTLGVLAGMAIRAALQRRLRGPRR